MICSILAFPDSASADPAGDGKRKVTVRWRPVDQAVRYDFQLATTPDMDPLALRKDIEAVRTALRLAPGTYYFRVRGIDAADAPGPWSEVEGFVVNPAPPTPLEPGNKQVFSAPVPEEGLLFRWSSGIRGTEYRLQIDDGRGFIVDRNVRTNRLRWKPEKPGRYRWRVGVENATGQEWSEFSWIGLKESAFPKPNTSAEALADHATRAAEPLSDDDLRLLEEIKKEKEFAKRREALSLKPGYWLILRYAQSVVAYAGRDVDIDRGSSGAAVVALGSAEIRWRAGRSKSNPWTLSASANFEMLNQTILGESHMQPRAFGRVFYSRSFDKWRIGPFLHFGAGQGLIFIVQSETEALSTKISRMQAGLGGSAVFGASDTLYFSAIAMLRRDMGGTSEALPTELESGFGFEAGFGVFFNFAERWSIEARIRGLGESYSWMPAAGGDLLSNMTNTFIILDGGIGFQF